MSRRVWPFDKKYIRQSIVGFSRLLMVCKIYYPFTFEISFFSPSQFNLSDKNAKQQMQLSVIMRSQANCVLISDLRVISLGIRYLTLNISSTNYGYKLKNYDQVLSFFRFSWSVGLNIHSVDLKPTEGIKALREIPFSHSKHIPLCNDFFPRKDSIDNVAL